MRHRIAPVAVILALVAGASAASAPPAAAAVDHIDVGAQGPMVIDPADGRVYVTTSSNTMTVIDSATRTVVGSVNYGANAQQLALDPAGGGILAAASQNHLERIRSNATLGSPVPLPYDYAVYPIATSPALGRVYLRDVRFVGPGNYQERLIAVNLSPPFVVADILPPTPPAGLAIDDAADRVYVSVGSSIGVYNRSLSTLVTTIAMSGAAGKLVLDADADRLLAVTGNDVAVIDTATQSIIESIPGTSPVTDLAIDAARDRLFVLRNRYPDPGLLDVYEGGTLVESLPAGVSPVAFIVEPATGNAWVGDALTGRVLIVTPGSPAAGDADLDGTTDDIDADGGDGTSPAGAFSDDTGDGHTTTGSITSTGGLDLAIADSADPAGVLVTTGLGGDYATLSVCGGFNIEVELTSQAVVTCGSVTVAVTAGSARIVLGGGLGTVSIPTGASAKVTDTGGGTFSVANVGPSGAPAVTLTVDGVSTPVGAGTTTQAAAWDFVGFSQPIDNAPVLNRATAGLAIPVKWRILGASGAPVTTLASARLTVTGLSCALGSTVDLIEETASGESGLKNLGNGYYQLNWKSPKTYASSCKVLHLDIGDGVLHDALFQFTK